MKYKKLKPGEILRSTDQFMIGGSHKWRLTELAGSPACDCCEYRRPCRSVGKTTPNIRRASRRKIKSSKVRRNARA